MKIIARDCKITMGIDASTKSLSITVLREGQFVKHANVPYSRNALESFLNRFAGCCIRSVYEASSIGYWLHDTLIELGVQNTVTPPSKTPRSSSDRVKTDRRDSMKLARLHEAGLLKAIGVPGQEQRAARQLLRTRRQISGQRTRTMRQIRSLLLFHHIERPQQVGKPWTQSYLQWLASVPFSSTEGGLSLRQALDALLKVYHELTGQVKALTQQVVRMGADPCYRSHADALQSNPGIGVLTALTILSEIGSIRRFANSQQFASYLGLTPSEYSRGETQRQGHITRAGNTHIRALLVECCWIWISKDQAAYRIYRRIARRRERQRAIVAMARRLATRIYWQLRQLEKHKAVS
ncbi:MAG: IS110 family transposase [Polyangiaceae bacterium]|nr:IS110 family transposase [Polyangiaceae bacterium]